MRADVGEVDADAESAIHWSEDLPWKMQFPIRLQNNRSIIYAYHDGLSSGVV